jgi:hypothetical protein
MSHLPRGQDKGMPVVKDPSGACAEYVDVSIEFGHMSLRAAEHGAIANETAAAASDLRAELLSRGWTVATQVLLDDKRAHLAAIEDLPAGVVVRLAQLDKKCPIDCIALESTLMPLHHELLERIDPQQRGRLSRSISEYLREAEVLACSHDVGIWHALRLGALSTKEVPAWQVHLKPTTVPVAQVAVSVLERVPSIESAERSARRTILRHIQTNDGVRCSERTLAIFVATARDINLAPTVSRIERLLGRKR